MDPVDDERALADLYREMWRCMVAADIGGLAAVCSDGFVLHHMTGMSQGREEFLRAVGEGALRYYSAAHDRVQAHVRADGETASIVGRTRTEASVFGGARHAWRLEARLQARREDGVWRLLDERVSTY